MDSPSDNENVTNHDDIFSPQLMRHIAQLAGEAVYTTRSKKIRMRTSTLSGRQYVQEVLACENPRRVQEIMRMPKDTFFALCTLLRAEGLLADTRNVAVEEQVAMFMAVVGKRGHIHAVLAALLDLFHNTVRLPSPCTPRFVARNPKFFPFFKDCFGALDGSHVRVHVPENLQPRYRNRKQYTSQNVLAACTFDLQFCYVLAGYEGSAHDSRVLAHALELPIESRFVIPDGKYYLADAGYGLRTGILTPYRGVRYHLKETARANQRPKNPKELFNLCHASLRNAIERIFGVVKKRRFPILYWAGVFTEARGREKSGATMCLLLKFWRSLLFRLMAEYTENCQTLCSPQGFPETETEQYSVSRRGTEFGSKTGTEK